MAYYSMRWDDTWPTARKKLDYIMTHTNTDSTGTYSHYASSGNSGVVDDDDADNHADAASQYPVNYPVRRRSHFSLNPLDICLRIKVHDLNTSDDDAPVAPNWIQFQTLVGKGSSLHGPDWDNDTVGRSIVSPADSDNPGLLAVGASSLLKSSIGVTEYSSRGPVFDKTDTLSKGSPSRIKPDVVASTEGATITNWKHVCQKPLKRIFGCGDDLYFSGTSGATAHTGGIAAVVAGFLKDANALQEPEDAANLIRNTATYKGSAYRWGKGFINLPCPATAYYSNTFIENGGKWKADDCAGFVSGSKADFHTFYVPRTKKVTIDLASDDKDAYLLLRKGAHSKGGVVAFDNDNDADSSATGTDAKITAVILKGPYTIEATTRTGNSVGGEYTLDVRSVDFTETAKLEKFSTVRRGNSWQNFQVVSNVPVKVVVNPTGTSRKLQVASSSASSRSCRASSNQSVKRDNGEYIYLRGCSTGTTYLDLRSAGTDTLLKRYAVSVTKLKPR